MEYEFLNKDGSRYTLMETENPEQELEVIRKYNPGVVSYQEYIAPEPEIKSEEEIEQFE